MRLFETPGADAAYEKFLEPPSLHEEDGCERCHDYHKRKFIYVKTCIFCQEENNEQTL